MLNLKRENVIRKSAQEIAMSNDLLRRLVRGLIEEGGKVKKEPLKSMPTIRKVISGEVHGHHDAGKDGVTMEKRGNVVLLKTSQSFKNWIRQNHVYLYYLA